MTSRMSPEKPLRSERSVLVAALYKFVPIDDLLELQTQLRAFCVEAGIKGTLLLASEGLNLSLIHI